MADDEQAADGYARSETGVFIGRPGLVRLSGAGVFTALDPDAFRAEVTVKRIGMTTLTLMSASPHSFSGRAEHATDEPQGSIRLTHLLRGFLRSSRDSEDFVVRPGELTVLRTGSPYGFDAPEGVALISSAVEVAHFPRHLIETGLLRQGPMRTTRLVLSYTAFIRALMDGTPGRETTETEYLGHALLDLEIAIVAEAVGVAAPRMGVEGTRFRVLEHIERHLVDPGLGPASIASALGISVRYVHRAFDDTETSVTRTVRERRVQAIASAIAADDDAPRVVDLAARFGFGGPDPLTRAFKRRFGCTVREYWEDHPKIADAHGADAHGADAHGADAHGADVNSAD